MTRYVPFTQYLVWSSFHLIALTMETVRTSEMSVSFNVTTRRYLPEDSKLHIRCSVHNCSYQNYESSLQPRVLLLVHILILSSYLDSCVFKSPVSFRCSDQNVYIYHRHARYTYVLSHPQLATLIYLVKNTDYGAYCAFFPSYCYAVVSHKASHSLRPFVIYCASPTEF
jgi:hypothetical protein